MWILDTNVVSELVAVTPSPRVLEWMGQVSRHDVYTTAITEAEIFYGIERLLARRRREGLRLELEMIFSSDLAGRVLPFDGGAARRYARLFAQREAAGRTMSLPDAQIAAIALEQRAVLATRNIRDFSDCELELVNPWAS